MKLEILNLGLIDYNTAWDIQKELAEKVKLSRGIGYMVICQHPTVITIGKNGSEANVVLPREEQIIRNVQVIFNNRGGDVTLHNEGQLVVYPIFDLSSLREDLHWFLRELEDAIIELLKLYGITADRYEGYTGVWLEQSRKICAMGLHCSRWVTSHGLALNVNNRIEEFDFIIPCGIKEKAVTSIANECGTLVDMDILTKQLISIFEDKFAQVTAKNENLFA
jgi:lipoyl(octanoyl) transferase